MGPVYLAAIAVVTLAGVLFAAGAASEGARTGRLARLLALWVLAVGLGGPASRLTLDLAFVFGSQLTLLAALAVLVKEARR